MNLSIVGSMFAVGLVTSIHCVFMCGGLVLTYAVKGAEDGPWYRRLVPHLAYQGAKIVSYATVALLLGGLVVLLGRAVDITPFRNWLQVVAGVYMVLLGIGMTGKVKVLRYLTPRPPKFLVDALSKNRKKANTDASEGNASLVTPITFGLLTGLMPCAPLIAAQTSAMSLGSPLLGVAAMVAFGLGTMPLMLAFGFASSLLSRGFQAKMQVVAAVAVVIFGFVILNRGLMVVGSPVTFDTIRTAVIGSGQPAASSSDTSATLYAKGADGVVEIPLTIENATYIPQNLSIPADTPVRLIVDRREANACSAQLAIPRAGVLANLADNDITKVDIPAMPAGSYTLTCGMGMLSGSVSVGGGGGGGSSPLLLPSVLLALLGGGYAVYSYRRSHRTRPAAPVKSGRGAGTAHDKGRSGGPGGSRAGKSAPAGRTGHAPAPSPVPARGGALAALGFEPAEAFIGGSVVVIASIIGLASGGFFR